MPAILQRLADLGILLPPPAAPVAAYVPFVITDHLVFISGQLPMENGAVRYQGRLGDHIDLATGQAAARLCALNLLAQLQRACDQDWDRVEGCVRLGGFVASALDFFDQPKVLNGASDLMLEVFGEAGRHARAAVGVSALPLNAAVEIEAVFALKP